MEKTIGIVEVAALAASAAESPPVATRMATERPASSAASAGSRSTWPSAHLYSIATFWPSTYPLSTKPRRNAATRCVVSSGDRALRYPITGIAGCCARAASGHAAAAPPRAKINARRFIQSPRRRAAGMVSKNLTPSIVNLTVKRRYLTQREIERLMDCARKHGRYGHRDATMILVAYRHGLRASEVCDLQWQQIELSEGRLHVHRLKNGISSVH